MATGKKKTAGKKASGKKAAGKKTALVKKASGRTAASRETAGPKSATAPAKGKTAPNAARATSKRTGLLNIDYSLCKGCGGCADAFPRLFEMRGDLAWVIDAEAFDPQRDSGVLTVCPYYAITLE